MGRQIRIAQSLEDEAEINQALVEKFQLFCLPRIFTFEQSQPVKLGNLLANEQVLFLEEYKDLVVKHIVPVVSKQGQYRVQFSFLGVEWLRSHQEISGRYLSGRYYYNSSDSQIDPRIFAKTTKVYNFLYRVIKKRYPKISDDPGRIYVGSNLSAMIERKQAEVVYPNGTLVKLFGVKTR